MTVTETRLMELELNSLEKRRFIADVTFRYKVLLIINYLNLDISSYLNVYSLDDQYTLRGFHCLKLRKNYARTSDIKFSFFNVIGNRCNKKVDVQLGSTVCLQLEVEYRISNMINISPAIVLFLRNVLTYSHINI